MESGADGWMVCNGGLGGGWRGGGGDEPVGDGGLIGIVGGSGGLEFLGGGGGVEGVWELGGRMARRVMAVAAVLVRLAVMAAVLAVPVLAQTSPPAAPSPDQTITCSLPSTLMISADYCNADDEQSMDTQTQSCQGFLTDSEAAPNAACCLGLNNVAYNRTACICKMTFYPTASHNTSRHLDLPGLCNVQTNLCVKCPGFLTTASNVTNATPACKFSRPSTPRVSLSYIPKGTSNVWRWDRTRSLLLGVSLNSRLYILYLSLSQAILHV